MSPEKVETGESTKETNKGKKAEWEVDTTNSALETALKTGDKELIKAARASLEGAQDGRMDRQDDFISPEVKATIKREGSSPETFVPSAENKDGETFTTLDAAVDKYKGGEAVKEAVTKLQEKRNAGTLEADDADLKTVMEFLAKAEKEDRKKEVSEATSQGEDKAVAKSFEMYVSQGNTTKDQENLQYLVSYLAGNLGESEITTAHLESAKVSLSKLIQSASFGKPVGVAGNPLESAYDSANESIAVHAQAFSEKLSEKMAREESGKEKEGDVIDIESLTSKLESWKSEARVAKAEAKAALAEAELKGSKKELEELRTAFEKLEANDKKTEKRISDIEAALANADGKNGVPSGSEAPNRGETPQKLEGQSEKESLAKIHEFLESNLDKEDIQNLYRKLYSIGYNRNEVVDSNIENYFTENPNTPGADLERKLREAGYTPEEIARYKNKNKEQDEVDGDGPTPAPVDGGDGPAPVTGGEEVKEEDSEKNKRFPAPFLAPLPQDEDGEKPRKPIGPEDIIDGAVININSIVELNQIIQFIISNGGEVTSQTSNEDNSITNIEFTSGDTNIVNNITIIMGGGKGEDGKDGKDGKDAEKVDPVEKEKGALEALRLNEMPGYQEVVNARDAYLKALITRFKIFRRAGREELFALEKTYNDTLNAFLQRNIGDGINTELAGLAEGPERAAKITEYANRMSIAFVQEMRDFTRMEAEISNDTAAHRIINSIRKHPFLRLAASGALLVAGGVAASNPVTAMAIPGIVVAAGALNGVGSGLFAESVIDGGAGILGRLPGGDRRNVSEEILSQLSDQAILQRFAAIEARNASRGQDYESKPARADLELFNKLTAEIQSRIAERIATRLATGVPAEGARADVLLEDMGINNQREIQHAHDSRRVFNGVKNTIAVATAAFFFWKTVSPVIKPEPTPPPAVQGETPPPPVTGGGGTPPGPEAAAHPFTYAYSEAPEHLLRHFGPEQLGQKLSPDEQGHLINALYDRFGAHGVFQGVNLTEHTPNNIWITNPGGVTTGLTPEAIAFSKEFLNGK